MFATFVLASSLSLSDTEDMLSFIWGLFGLAIGSFLNVVIDRTPNGESIVWDRSRCDHCKRTLVWYEIIPVLSFLLLRGRCRTCRKRLSWQYPLVEFVTAAGFYWVSTLSLSPMSMIFGAVLFATVVVMTVIDAKHQIIPDTGLIVSLFCLLIFSVAVPYSVLRDHVIAGGINGAIFLSLWLGTRGRGIGFGDVKLSIVIGLFLGGIGTVIAGYVAFLTGAFWGVILMIRGRAKMKSRIAFGPFLLLGALVAYIWSADLYIWWMSLMGL